MANIEVLTQQEMDHRLRLPTLTITRQGGLPSRWKKCRPIFTGAACHVSNHQERPPNYGTFNHSEEAEGNNNSGQSHLKENAIPLPSPPAVAILTCLAP